MSGICHMCISLIQPFLPKYTYVQVPLSIVSSGPPLNQLAGHAPGTCHVYIKYLSNQSTYYLTGSIEHWQVVDVVCGTTGWHHNWTAFINTWYCHRPATETLHDVVKTIQQQQNIIQSEVQQQQKKLKAHVVPNVQRQQEHLRMKKQEWRSRTRGGAPSTKTPVPWLKVCFKSSCL